MKMQSYDEIDGITDTLFADAVYFREQLHHHSDNQHLRRAFIRSVFALIEGTCFYWRYMINDNLRFNPELFNEDEKLMLGEQAENKDGKIRDKNYPTADLIGFSLKMLAKNAGEEIDLGTVGWERLKSSLGVRDRITHPRSNKTLEISNEELNEVREALSWYFSIENSLLKKILEKGTFIQEDGT